MNRLSRKEGGYLVIKYILALTVSVAYLVFTGVSFGTPSSICEYGANRDNSIIRTLDVDCEDGFCGVVLSVPLLASDRDFEVFTLYKRYGNDVVMRMNLKHSDDYRGNAEVAFYGTRQQLEGVEIYAVYERIMEDCPLHAVWEYDNVAYYEASD